MKKYTQGFTLIELLVVIAIIAMLATMIIASLTSAQSRSRDARRVQDINQIQKALELYMVGHGRYPGTELASTTLDGTASDNVSSALLSDKAMSTIPRDPLTPDFEYHYTAGTRKTTYTLGWCMETTSVKGTTADCTNTITP